MILENRFDGHSAVITGDASGTGRDIAARLAAEGARVSLWDVNEKALAAAKAEIRAIHTQAIDVANADEVAQAMSATVEALGSRLNVLVTSAGITGPNVAVLDYPIEAWQRVIDINLSGLFYCNRAAVPYKKQNGYGRIVNIASVAGKEGNPNAAAYSASKAGVIGLTKSLGKELARTEIRVNCVTPGAVRTAIFDQMTQEHIDFMLSKIPLGRFGGVFDLPWRYRRPGVRTAGADGRRGGNGDRAGYSGGVFRNRGSIAVEDVNLMKG